uniref:Ras-associating domain-containing protein n=1 Tax=Angiostrongylus cantonensis TaxID=6313 RepID=A0A0K0CV55_ANGCA
LDFSTARALSCPPPIPSRRQVLEISLKETCSKAASLFPKLTMANVWIQELPTQETKNFLYTINCADPRLQIRQKCIHDIRELRSSIDNSLIKPPTPQRHHLRRTSTASIKANSELHDESEDEKPRITPKLNITKAKSPFRRTVESGSDLDSIDFEVCERFSLLAFSI